MATQYNAEYKVRQRKAAIESGNSVVRLRSGVSVSNIVAVRDGKLNKKSGRRLATSYKRAG